MGVDVPPYMHQALLDQHGHSTAGQYPYSTTVENTQHTLVSQPLVMDGSRGGWPYGECLPAYGYTWTVEDSQGDLAGIGAQFVD